MGDPNIHCGSCRDVSTFPTLLLFVRAEESGVVALLNHNKCYPRLVVWLKLDASFSDGGQFMLQHMWELAFTYLFKKFQI